MTKWLFLIVVGLITALSVALGIVYTRLESVQKKYSVAMANVKEYDKALGNSNETNMALQLTISQLGYFNDSILKELKHTTDELNIKDKNLKALQAITSTFIKTDTIVMNDTIFINPALSVDTVLKDEWYSVTLGLRYPSTISVSPCFVSKKHIVVSTKKETVNPPKKWWIQRVFQKKHKVLHVNVVEKNPYVQDEGSRYIEILK